MPGDPHLQGRIVTQLGSPFHEDGPRLLKGFYIVQVHCVEAMSPSDPEGGSVFIAGPFPLPGELQVGMRSEALHDPVYPVEPVPGLAVWDRYPQPARQRLGDEIEHLARVSGRYGSNEMN